MATTLQVTFDALNPDKQAAFWAEALGYNVEAPPPGFDSWADFLAFEGVPEKHWNDRSAIVDPTGKRPRVYFQKIDAPKTSPNRIHLDLTVGGGPAAPRADRVRRIQDTATRLGSMGATVKRTVDRDDDYWVVMQDPEGNEFCLQ